MVPYLAKNGMLCKEYINKIVIEWHGQALNVKSENCEQGPTEIIKLDDESYLNDGQPLPDQCNKITPEMARDLDN